MLKSYQKIAKKKFIDIWESIWFFSIFNDFKKKLKNERKVANFGYILVPRFHITHKNFSGDWTNSCTVRAAIFYKQ